MYTVHTAIGVILCLRMRKCQFASISPHTNSRLSYIITWKGKIGVTVNHIHRIYRNRSSLKENVSIFFNKIKSGSELIIDNPLAILLSSKTLNGIQCFYSEWHSFMIWNERHYSNLIGKIKRNSIAKDEIFLSLKKRRNKEGARKQENISQLIEWQTFPMDSINWMSSFRSMICGQSISISIATRYTDCWACGWSYYHFQFEIVCASNIVIFQRPSRE